MKGFSQCLLSRMQLLCVDTSIKNVFCGLFTNVITDFLCGMYTVGFHCYQGIVLVHIHSNSLFLKLVILGGKLLAIYSYKHDPEFGIFCDL